MNVLTNSDSMDYPYNLDDPGPAAQAAVCRLRSPTKTLWHMTSVRPADWPCRANGSLQTQALDKAARAYGKDETCRLALPRKRQFADSGLGQSCSGIWQG